MMTALSVLVGSMAMMRRRSSERLKLEDLTFAASGLSSLFKAMKTHSFALTQPNACNRKSEVRHRSSKFDSENQRSVGCSEQGLYGRGASGEL